MNVIRTLNSVLDLSFLHNQNCPFDSSVTCATDWLKSIAEQLQTQPLTMPKYKSQYKTAALTLSRCVVCRRVGKFYCKSCNKINYCSKKCRKIYEGHTLICELIDHARVIATENLDDRSC